MTIVPDVPEGEPAFVSDVVEPLVEPVVPESLVESVVPEPLVEPDVVVPAVELVGTRPTASADVTHSPTPVETVMILAVPLKS
jgi:hypothetical protein